jgi:tetratricopeptide (TPR) repeat protein
VGLVVRFNNWLLMLIIVSLTVTIMEPVLGQGLGMRNPARVTNSAYAYCMNHGGIPQDGKCYFPDGGYCDIWSYYNGTCPSLSTREQGMWEAEAYAFLNGGEGGYPGYPIYQPSNYGVPVGSYSLTGYGTASLWMNQGNQLYAAGSYEQAAAMYTRAVNLDPSLKTAWLNQGNAFYFLGRYQESLNAFETVLYTEPQNAAAWQGKGLDLVALSRTIEANDAFARARALQGQ